MEANQQRGAGGMKEGRRGDRPVPRAGRVRRRWQRAIGRVRRCSPDGRAVLEGRVHRARACGRGGLAWTVVVSAAAVVKMRQGVGSATGWWRPRVMGEKGERGRQIN
jgi:hypothetical protein